MPSEWPFLESREALEGLFLSRAGQSTCLTCHAKDNTGAMMVFAAIADPGQLSPDKQAEYDETRTNLWNLVTTSEPATWETENPVGRFWFHHPNYVTADDNEPLYLERDIPLINFLNAMYEKAQACSNQAYLTMPADAGPSCGNPMPRDGGPAPQDGGMADGGAQDAGMPDAGMPDGGPMDGGPMDAGGADAAPRDAGALTGLCYCDELPDGGLRPDLIQYCQ